MIVGWLSTKIAQIVPLRWTRWPPGLKIEKKPLNDVSSINTWPILTKLHRNDRSVTLYQNCPKGSTLLHKMPARAKNKTIFKRHFLHNHCANFDKTLQELSLGDPLPQLPKWFRFAIGHMWSLNSCERSRAILALFFCKLLVIEKYQDKEINQRM